MNAYTLKPGDRVCGQYFDTFYSGSVILARRHTVNARKMTIHVHLDAPIVARYTGHTLDSICIVCNQFGMDNTDSSIEYPLDLAIPFWPLFFAALVCYFAFDQAGVSWL